MLSRVPLVIAAVVGVLAPAASAGAATLDADRACYIEKQPMQLGGNGFGAGDPISLSGEQISVSGPADANGGFLATVKAPLLGTAAPATRTFTITATDDTTGVQATADVQVATFTFATSGGVKSPRAARTWMFTGFIQKPGKAIYGHFRHNGRTFANYRFGTPTGACGTLKRRAPGIPVRNVASGRWNVQVDFQRSYDRNASPRVTSSTTVFTTFR